MWKEWLKQSQEQGFNGQTTMMHKVVMQTPTGGSKIPKGQGRISDSVTETNHSWGIKTFPFQRKLEHRANLEIMNLSIIGE